MPCFCGNGNACLRHWRHWRDRRFCFVVVIGDAPFAGFAAEGGGVVGAEVVFDCVPEVEDEGVDGGALGADGFLAEVVGGSRQGWETVKRKNLRGAGPMGTLKVCVHPVPVSGMGVQGSAAKSVVHSAP